jgi:hypothetical protein
MARRASRSAYYTQAANVDMREVAGDVFLACRDTQSIHRLNSAGAAFWRAIEQPRRLGDIVELFVLAFPDVPRRKIKTDCTRLAHELARLKLVETRDDLAEDARTADPDLHPPAQSDGSAAQATPGNKNGPG